MGFLSKTAKTESAFESFYGTSMAGSEVATSEMSEQEVCNRFDALISLMNLIAPDTPVNLDACVECISLHQGRT
jgi:hypothetical protein